VFASKSEHQVAAEGAEDIRVLKPSLVAKFSFRQEPEPLSRVRTSLCFAGAATILLVCIAPAHAETLEEAVARAVATFPEIQTGAANRRAAIAAISEARAGYFPTLDVTVGYGREQSDNVNTRAATQGGEVTLNRTEAEVTLSQLVFDGGAVSSQVRLQESRSDSAAYDLANTAQTIALRAARAYLEVLRLRSVIEIAQVNVTVHQRTLEQVTMLFERGAGRRSDAQQAEARLALARSTLTALRGQLEQAESEYRRLTGLAPQQLEKPTVPLERLPRDEQTALEEALTGHPALKASQAELAVARADLQVSRTRYIPRVNLELSAGQNNNLDGVRGTTADRIVALRLRYNLFRGGADSARIREAEARVERALADVANVRINLEREVRATWEALQAEREQLAYLQAHAETSADVVEAYRNQFRLGLRTLLDVLNTENELFNARSALVNGVSAVAADSYRLFAGTGRLLEVLGAALPDEARAAQ